MALPRAETVPGLLDELARFETLVRDLEPDAWARPSRCSGWSAGDVAAHVAGSMTDVVNGRLEGLGTPEVTEREVVERRGHSPADIADELQIATKLTADITSGIDDAAWDGPAGGGLDMTLGEGVEALWFDAYLHNLDVRDAVGLPPFTSAALRASVSHIAAVLTQQGYRAATIALDGIDEFTVSGGGGARITGDPLRFVLVATGRANPTELGLDETVNIYR